MHTSSLKTHSPANKVPVGCLSTGQLSPVASRYYLPTSVTGRFGLRLRQLRRERKLTQADMADHFGIDRTFISDVERGKKSCSLTTLEIIALGMKISLSDLFTDL